MKSLLFLVRSGEECGCGLSGPFVEQEDEKGNPVKRNIH